MEAAAQPSGAALRSMHRSQRKGEGAQMGLCLLGPRSISCCTTQGFFPPFLTSPWRCPQQERKEAMI